MTLIVDNIVKTFGENDSATQVLKGINFEINKGSLSSLMALPAQVKRHY